jgi:signal transduction histidine kinase
MNSTSPRSAARATFSTHNEFRRAHITLTAYYSAGVFLVLVLFSFLVYGLFIKNLAFDTDENGYVIVEGGVPADHDDGGIAESPRSTEARDRLITILLTADAVLFGCIIILSYVLARATLKPIERSYLQQKRFISDAAHELRTPLAVMKAGAEVALSGAPSQKEYRAFVEEALHEVQHMSHMTDDLLFLARTGEMRTDQPKEHVAMTALCEQTVARMQSYARDKDVTMTCTAQSGVAVFGRLPHLRRLIMNVVKNAIDYNVPHGSVTVSLSREGNTAVITVIDTGIGIPTGDLEHVFDRFYKADTSRTANHTEGSGLGLSIVKEIVDEHGGKISVASTVGKGTRIEIRLSTVA